MKQETFNILSLVVAIVVPLIGALYTYFTNRAAKIERQELREEQQRIRDEQKELDAVGQYRQVKSAQRYFKEDITKLIVSLSSSEKSEDDIYASFLSSYNSFTDLYNEANAFCALLNKRSVLSEDVLKNTGIDLVIKLADDQCDFYERLKVAAEKSGHKNEMKRPDWNAFQEYDKFLQFRLSEKKWNELCEKRKKVGLKP